MRPSVIGRSRRQSSSSNSSSGSSGFVNGTHETRRRPGWPWTFAGAPVGFERRVVGTSPLRVAEHPPGLVDRGHVGAARAVGEVGMVQPGELAVGRLDVGSCCGRRHAEPLVVRFHAVYSPSAPRSRTHWSLDPPGRCVQPHGARGRTRVVAPCPPGKGWKNAGWSCPTRSPCSSSTIKRPSAAPPAPWSPPPPGSTWSARPRAARRRSSWPTPSNPGLVLMDINLPGINGIEATRRITAAHPRRS